MRRARPLAGDDAAVGVGGVGRAEGREARERLVDEDAEGPPVRAPPVPPVEEDLGGDVVRGAAEGVGPAAAREDLANREREREGEFVVVVVVVVAETGRGRREREREREESARERGGEFFSFFLSISFFLSPVPTLANPMSVTLRCPEESSRRFSGFVFE